MVATLTRYRELSFWHSSVPDDLAPRAPLAANTTVDVAIIGGGLTGLWTAYYLLAASPNLHVVVLEKEIAGFGASGRNGGWCSALFPRSTGSLVRAHGLDAALTLRRAMIATVDEVARVTNAEGIDCDFLKGGTVTFARTDVHARAADAEVAEAARYGVDPLERKAHSVFDPNCARLHPGKLVRGLARVVERLGGEIFEQTEVTGWSAGTVVTDRGTVKAGTVVVALEGYAANIRQTHRRVLPLYSLMIATEPLPDALWSEMGIEHGQTFTDYRHLLVYGQRTADNRFAFGGRGARYHWGSAIRPGFDHDPHVFEHLAMALAGLFPQAADARITHRWGGPLGVPRDWHAGVLLDKTTRIASAGGYVGDGLSTTNLAGRTLADLILDADTELARLPWVQHRSPGWEVEPLRFAGTNLGMTAMAAADAEERLTHRSSVIAKLMGPLVGH